LNTQRLGAFPLLHFRHQQQIIGWRVRERVWCKDTLASKVVVRVFSTSKKNAHLDQTDFYWFFIGCFSFMTSYTILLYHCGI